jgi:hypothetical protein
MRRTLAISVAAVGALALSAVAVAQLRSSGTDSVSATFSAARERAETRTCSGPDGNYEITSGRYAGTAAGSDPLNGPIVLHVRSVYNTTESLGWIEGSFQIRRGGDDLRSHGRFWATLGAGGTVNGFVHGLVNRNAAALFGGLTATFTPSGGFASGKLGGGGAQVNAAVTAGRPCVTTKTPVVVRLIVHGQVEALSAGSITVKPRDGSPAQTCAIKAGVSGSTRGVATGDTVELRCGIVDGTMTLLRLNKKRGDDD